MKKSISKTKSKKSKLTLFEGKPGKSLQALLNAVAKGEIAEDAIIQPLKPKPAQKQWTPEQIKQKVNEEILVNSLGELLEKARLSKGVSAIHQAKKLGVSRSQVYQNEDPKANLELATLLRHAEALGYSVEVVLTAKDAGKRLVAVL